MAKPKQEEPKIEIEREYIVPLRREWLKVPKYKRANKAAKALKQFMVRHMKVYDRDLRKIKLDIDLNNEIRFRGIKKPLAKVKVKAIKYSTGIVRVALVDIPEGIKFKRLREEKKKLKLDKKAKEKDEEKKAKEEPKSEEKTGEKTAEEKKKVEMEKEESSFEEELMKSKQEAKEIKHLSKDKKPTMHRVALQK